jgi:hypothetical protein
LKREGTETGKAILIGLATEPLRLITSIIPIDKGARSMVDIGAGSVPKTGDANRQAEES